MDGPPRTLRSPPPSGRTVPLGRPGGRMNDPHALCVRCPPRGRTVPRPAGRVDESASPAHFVRRPPRGLRQCPLGRPGVELTRGSSRAAKSTRTPARGRSTPRCRRPSSSMARRPITASGRCSRAISRITDGTCSPSTCRDTAAPAVLRWRRSRRSRTGFPRCSTRRRSARPRSSAIRWDRWRRSIARPGTRRGSPRSR